MDSNEIFIKKKIITLVWDPKIKLGRKSPFFLVKTFSFYPFFSYPASIKLHFATYLLLHLEADLPSP